jgi:hypothetical protein
VRPTSYGRTSQRGNRHAEHASQVFAQHLQRLPRGETGTVFTPISETGALSGFLAGITIPDAAGEGVTRTFNDLGNRKQKLAHLLSQPCIFRLFFEPLRMSH